MLLALTTLIAGCGKKSSASDDRSETGKTFPVTISKDFLSEVELPICTHSIESQLVYLKNTNAFRYCEDGEWIPITIVGEKGEKGVVGQTGMKGEKGNEGIAGKDRLNTPYCLG